MKKKIILGIAVLAMTTIVAFNVNLEKKNDFSTLSLDNIEALANNGESSGTTLWIRKDEDCTYTIEGKAGATVTFTIAGQSFSLKIGADGKATYTYSNGKTDCTSGGRQQCTARYCPTLG